MTFSDAARAAELVPSVGIQALTSVDRPCVKKQNGTTFTGSVNIDDSFRILEPNANRWDYGIGYQTADVEYVVWIEPHSAASTHEISTMLKKLQWMRDKLASPPFEELCKLTEKTRKKGIRQFWWVTSGSISIRKGTPQANRLAQSGLNFPCKAVTLGKE